MPIYEYRCEKGHTFDVMQRHDDAPVAKCEVCGRPVRRVFHPIAVHFKGSGFYNTDYGTRKRQREQAASSESKNGSDASSKKDGATASSDGSSSGAAKSDGAKPAKDKAKSAPAKTGK